MFYVVVEYVAGTVIFDAFKSNFPLHYFKCRVISRISTPVQFKVDPVRIYRSPDPNRSENRKSRFDTGRVSVLDRPMYISVHKGTPFKSVLIQLKELGRVHLFAMNDSCLFGSPG